MNCAQHQFDEVEKQLLQSNLFLLAVVIHQVDT